MALRLSAAGWIGALALFAAPAGAQDLDRGEDLYQLCSACHGPAGLGNPDIEAPPIGGLGAWYIEAQLKKFNSGARGTHPEDASGMRMRPMSLALKNEADMASVAAYVASFPDPEIEATLEGGDPEKGKTHYAACAACHGPEGDGRENQFAPALVAQSDWYLASSLHKFKAGLRGTNPADTTGAMMRPMSMILADDQAVRDVVAYILTLSK